MINVVAALGPLAYPSHSDFFFKAMHVQPIPISIVVFTTKIPLYFKYKIVLLTRWDILGGHGGGVTVLYQ